MPINALNDLHITNGPQKILNFDMDHVMVYMECRNNLGPTDEALVSLPPLSLET